MGLEPRERIANNRSNYQNYTLDVLVLETMTPRGRLRSSGARTQYPGCRHTKKPDALRHPVNGEPTRGTRPGWLRYLNSLLLSTTSTWARLKQVQVLVSLS